MRTLTFRVPAAFELAVRKLADEQDRPVSRVLRELVQRGLDSHQAEMLRQQERAS